MQLGLNTPSAPPPIPAWGELSENSCQGFTSKNSAWNPGLKVCNFTVTLGLRAVLVRNGVRETYSARYYNPLTGRFLSSDPAEGDLTSPETLHKYLYADGDPVNGIDPTGWEDAETYPLILGRISASSATVYAVHATGVAVACLILWDATKFHAETQAGLNGSVEMVAPCIWMAKTATPPPPPLPLPVPTPGTPPNPWPSRMPRTQVSKRCRLRPRRQPGRMQCGHVNLAARGSVCCMGGMRRGAGTV